MLDFNFTYFRSWAYSSREQTSALDLANQLQMLDAVVAYTRKHQIVTLAILHGMNLATRYADSTMV